MVSRLPPPTCRPVQTRFRFGFAAAPLNLAGDGKSPDHYAQGTPSGIPQLTPGHSPPTACRHVVSGSLSSPYRGSSHLSLALLGSLSVASEYLALRDGPRGFRLTSTCRVLLRCRIVRFRLPHTGLSPALVELSSSLLLGYSLSKHRSYNPTGTSPRGLGCFPFARRYSGNRGFFLFLRVLRCFSSPG